MRMSWQPVRSAICTHDTPFRFLALCRRRPYSLAAALFIAAYTVLALYLRYVTEEKIWIPPFTILGPPTLIYDVRDLRKVWQWEIAAGHYPSAHSGSRSDYQFPLL